MMDPHSNAELEAMMADLESDLVERKESVRGDSPSRIREAVCAFANDLPDYRRSGVIFVGASDDGKPVGLPITDELLLQFADIKTDGNIVPPPTLTVGKHVLLGQSVAVVTVRPSDTRARHGRRRRGPGGARRRLVDNGQPEPDFRVDPNWVHCTVKARP